MRVPKIATWAAERRRGRREKEESLQGEGKVQRKSLRAEYNQPRAECRRCPATLPCTSADSGLLEETPCRSLPLPLPPPLHLRLHLLHEGLLKQQQQQQTKHVTRNAVKWTVACKGFTHHRSPRWRAFRCRVLPRSRQQRRPCTWRSLPCSRA